MLQAMMAWANQSAPAMHMLATGAGAVGRIAQGAEARRIADAEARQYEARAKQSRAIGSIQAERMQRANDRLRGRTNALLAASGFSASDDGSQAIIGAMAREGAVQEMLIAAQAEQDAANDEYRAKLRRAQGKSAQGAYNLEAGMTLVSGWSSWRERFGSPDPEDAEDEEGAIPYSYGDPDPDPFHRNR